MSAIDEAGFHRLQTTFSSTQRVLSGVLLNTNEHLMQLSGTLKHATGVSQRWFKMISQAGSD